MRVLIVYYSFTDQAQIAAAVARDVAAQGGHDVAMLRVEIAEPAARLQRPLTWAQISTWGQMAARGETTEIIFDPASAAAEPCDLVLLFTNTWSFSPSVPIQSFLKSEAGGRLLAAKPVAIYVICRGFWKGNLAKSKTLVELAGGRVIASAAFTHPGAWLTSTIQTVRHMMSTAPQARWGIIALPPFGLSPASMARIAPFTRSVLDSAAERA